MSQSILLIGNGQVGKELEQILAGNVNLISFVRPIVDLAQPDSISKVVREYRPNIVINAAAYTAVDQAESEKELANTVNATSVGILGEECEKIGASLIHISTDYVFDGKGHSPYQETDITNPVSVYGSTKLAGEKAIQNTCSRYLILRTAWVYGYFGKSNFVKTMLRLGGEREEIRVVADQIGSPTWAKDIAIVIDCLMKNPALPEISGIYHYTNSGVASWYDFAVAIFEEAQQPSFPLKIQRVIPITTPEYPTPARRPHYSVLACSKISQLLGTYPPHWRQSLRKMLKSFLQ